MNTEDTDIVYAEREADPVRWQSYGGTPHFDEEFARTHAHRPHLEYPEGQAPAVEAQDGPQERAREEVELPDGTGPPRDDRQISPGASSSSTSISSVAQEEIRVDTRQRPYRLGSQMTYVVTNPDVERQIMNYIDRHPTAIRRLQDHRLQHLQTVGAAKVSEVDVVNLPPFGGKKPYPPPLPEREEYVVEFEGYDDPRHAQNWPLRKKIGISSILMLDALAATFASSVFSPTTQAIEQHFHVGQEVVVLSTSLFVLGYAFGPLIFAPMSELYGRRLPIIVASFGFAVFNIAVAVAKDYQTLVIGRFFAGLFGSSPLTVVAAVFSDMFGNNVRGLAVACFAAAIINGPFAGPMIGGFIAKSYLGWRWTAYIPAFMGFASCVLAIFFQDETYGPVILVKKAAELRRLTRNWGIHAKQEEVEVDLKELLSKNISRPLRILFTEPIVLLISIYMSFIYGLLYLSLTAYSLIFSGVYGFSLGVAGLPYMAMIVGVMIGFVLIVATNSNYVKKLEANNGITVPEWRMPLPMIGGVSFAAGLFWLGWTGWTRSIHWIVPTLAGLCLGFGIYSVFLQCLNYIIDAYLMFAASAIAANTILRSLFGAVFPLFATYMFKGIGINWGLTLLGCVAALFIPMPFVFYFYGKKIRARSKFAPAPDIEQDKQRDEESKGGSEGQDGILDHDTSLPSEGRKEQ